MKVMLDLKGIAIGISLYGIEDSDAMTEYCTHEG
jgi:hypothetical protein